MNISPYSLPLRGRLGRPGAWLDRREGLIVTVCDTEGAWGHGEAAPASWLRGASVTAVRAELERVSVAVASGSLEADRMLDALCGTPGTPGTPGPEQVLVERIDVEAAPAVKCAFETALLDLTARREGRALTAVLCEHGSRSRLPELPCRIGVNALLTAERAADVRREAEVAVDSGFTTLKLKVGSVSPEVDIERVRAVREGAGGKVRIRLDANRTWDAHTARMVLTVVADEDIEYVEEPLCSSSPARLAELAAETGCRLAVDESLDASPNAEAYIDELLECGAIAAAIVKPMALCGPRRAARLAARARAGGADVTFTDSIETVIGRSAVAHLAAASGSTDAVIGLGGAQLLARDIDGEPPARSPDVVVEGPGLGAAMPPHPETDP